MRERVRALVPYIGTCAILAMSTLTGLSAPVYIIETVQAASFTDTCGVFSGLSPAFSEAGVTRVEVVGEAAGSSLFTHPSIHIVGNDETGLLLGVNGASADSANGTAPFYTNVGSPSLGSATNYDGTIRPFFPALFITDLSVNPSLGNGEGVGDWQLSSTTRQVTDGVTVNGSFTFTSASAGFTAADTGKTIADVKAGIPAGTTITFVNATTVTMSNKATASNTGDITSIGFPITTSGASNYQTISGVTAPRADFAGGAWSTAVISGSTYTPTKPTNKNNWDFGPGVSAPGSAGQPPWRQLNQDVNTTAGSAALVATHPEFSVSDIGLVVDDNNQANTVGGGNKAIPGFYSTPATLTTIIAVTDSMHATMSANATASKTGDVVELYQKTMPIQSGFGAINTADMTNFLNQMYNVNHIVGTGTNGNEGLGTDVGWNADLSSNLRAWNSADKAYDAPLVAGHTYRFQVITHDGDQNGSNGPGGDVGEYCQTITLPATPTISTGPTLKPNDTATLSAASPNATGTITFGLFSPSDSKCTGIPAFTQQLPVAGNGSYSTSNTSFVASTPGEWRWQVIYSGDANNIGAASLCGVENFTITSG